MAAGALVNARGSYMAWLRCLVLLLLVAAGGIEIHGRELQGPQRENSKSVSELLKTDLGGQLRLSTGLRGVAVLVSYNMCVLPGVHSLWDENSG